MELNATHRCDRCGAQARHVATKPGTKSELLFCNHHYQKHRSKLQDEYWLIESDEEFADAVPAVV